MAAIASASGTSKSIVYRYFQDKDELKSALGESILSRMKHRLEEGVESGSTPAESIQTMVGMYVDAAASSVNVYNFITQPSEGLNRFLEDCSILIASAMKSIVPEPMLNAWAAGATGFVNATFTWWMESDKSMPKDDLKHLITTALLTGVINDDNATPNTLGGHL